MSSRYKQAGRVLRTLALWSACASLWCRPSTDAAGIIAGVVFTADRDGGRAVVPGAAVSLIGTSASQGTVSKETVSDDKGRYAFDALTQGTYRIEAQALHLRGSAVAESVAGRTLEIPVELKPEAVSESLTVTADGSPAVSTESSDQTVVEKSTIRNAPNLQERADALLPLVPGVVRGPDGLINMKGARSSQSGYLVNSASATDPVTGNAAISLPIDVVESVKVIADPYDPEYGRLTGAVASVETMTGNFNAFRMTMQNFMPRARRRDGDFVGIEASTPRMTLTGPLIKNRIAFTQSVEYRFVRTPVSSLPQLQQDIKLESVNSFSQADVILSPRQTMTVSFALYPQKLNYLGLNTFVPQPSTPDLHQRGDMASLQHRYTLSSDSILVSQFSYKRFDVDVTANSGDPYRLLVETTEGGFFDLQRRRTWRTEWQETGQFAKRFLGSHQFKIGTDFAHSSYDGHTRMLPVSIWGVSGLPIENIGFGPASTFSVHQNEMAWFAGDKWTPFPGLTLDLGLRFDRDGIADAIKAAPRAGFAYSLTRDARTLIKGGVGLFYDKVPLGVASFPLLPDRTIATLSPTGDALESISYTNTISGRLQNPRSVGWNVELDRQLTSALTVRAAFQERNTVRDFAITPVIESAGEGLLSHCNTGHSFYREFQAAGQYRFRGSTVNASYVRSTAFGNLNDFNQFFGNNAAAIIEPDARGRLAFDAPNRFLVWGQFQAPLKLTVSPVLDVHTGFPWSRTDELREYVGVRDSQRFPTFNSFDLQITRPVPLPFRHREFKARIGVSVFNVFNHFNPRDVQGDIDSYRYGDLFNGVGRTLRGKFIFEF